jgi:cell division protein FtsB
MASENKQRQRRQSRQNKSKQKRWMRPLQFTGMAVAGVLGAWLIFQFLIKVVHPYRLGYQQAQKVAEMRSDLNTQIGDNQRLQAQVTFLQSDEGAEMLARRNGYHRPGEVVYLLDQDAARAINAAPESTAPSVAPKAESTNAMPSPAPSP